ncbi:MAG: uroporphyrinogen decarboxylase family protein [bacterium]
MPTTPRERWIAVLNHEKPDRIPTDFWGTQEVIDRLLKDLKCPTEDDLWRELGVDKTHAVDPKYIGPEIRDGYNLWGVRYAKQSYADGMGSYDEVAECPLAKMTDPAELDDYPWPDPDWFDYSVIPEQLACLEEWPILAGHYEAFYFYSNMRGVEAALMDLAVSPEFADHALQKIFDFSYEYNRRMFEAAGKDSGILYTYIAEDLGSQSGLLMSLEMIDRFLLPRMRAMVDLAREYGIKTFHHDDGACFPALPRIAEIGIDILNPIQWRCPGMERDKLKREFGDAFVFHGGVDNQITLPFGTSDEVRNEVAENIRILGAGGGYIAAPCHNIQPNTPTKNILALYEAANKYGAY